MAIQIDSLQEQHFSQLKALKNRVFELEAENQTLQSEINLLQLRITNLEVKMDFLLNPKQSYSIEQQARAELGFLPLEN